MPKSPIHAVEDIDESIIPPVTVGDPLSADDLAIDQSHMEEFAMTDEGPAEVQCAKPPKGTFFAVYLETSAIWANRRFYFMLEVPNRDPYLVAPEIAKLKKAEGEDTIRPVLIVRYVTMAGDEGLWALKLDPPDGKSNLWNRSAMKALEAADEGKWVRLFSGKGQYTYQRVAEDVRADAAQDVLSHVRRADQLRVPGRADRPQRRSRDLGRLASGSEK